MTPSLTLDATVNTDFAQVEVDEQQVNLDRFNLFFPEKRPFFLENAGFFTMGSPGEVELFFSRRIGIGPEGGVVPILAGGRLSGKVGGFNVGLLNMQTRAVDDVVPGEQLHGGPGLAGAAQPLPRRGDLRQPRGHGGGRSVGGRQPDLRGGRQVGHRALLVDRGLRREDHHARAVSAGTTPSTSRRRTTHRPGS